MSAKILGGGGEQGHLWPAVYMLGSFEMYQIETPKIVHFFFLKYFGVLQTTGC